MTILLIILPLILGGALNMAFVKSAIFNSLKKPIDNNKVLKDGKRLFGDNKTYKGFLGMIITTSIGMNICGLICYAFNLSTTSLLYEKYTNNFLNNTIIGAILGLAYISFELPNSYMKRRVDIEPGKSKNLFFTFIDQIDSLIGCVIVMAFLFDKPFYYYIFLILIGAVAHYLVNIILYALKLRKNL